MVSYFAFQNVLTSPRNTNILMKPQKPKDDGKDELSDQPSCQPCSVAYVSRQPAFEMPIRRGLAEDGAQSSRSMMAAGRKSNACFTRSACERRLGRRLDRLAARRGRWRTRRDGACCASAFTCIWRPDGPMHRRSTLVASLRKRRHAAQVHAVLSTMILRPVSPCLPRIRGRMPVGFTWKSMNARRLSNGRATEEARRGSRLANGRIVLRAHGTSVTTRRERDLRLPSGRSPRMRDRRCAAFELARERARVHSGRGSGVSSVANPYICPDRP